MLSVRLLLIGALLTVGLAGGCASGSKPQGSSKIAGARQTGKNDVAAICIKCGQIKGSDLCCKPGQELCRTCGLVKGSPGCCKLPKGANADVELCTKCGFIKGSTDCCKPVGKQKCASCGLVKGSPGCCKIK